MEISRRDVRLDKVVDRVGATPSISCIVCSKTTREGKLYCSEHVEHAEHAKCVLAEIDRRKREVACVARRPRAAETDHFVVREILVQLSAFGDRTVPRLARDLREDLGVINAYVSLMAKKKIVCIGATLRGERVVRLAG